MKSKKNRFISAIATVLILLCCSGFSPQPVYAEALQEGWFLWDGVWVRGTMCSDIGMFTSGENMTVIPPWEFRDADGIVIKTGKEILETKWSTTDPNAHGLVKNLDAYLSLTSKNGLMVISKELLTFQIVDKITGKVISSGKSVYDISAPENLFNGFKGPFVLTMKNVEGNSEDVVFNFNTKTRCTTPTVNALTSFSDECGVMVIAKEPLSIEIKEAETGKSVISASDKWIFSCPSTKLAGFTGPFVMTETNNDGVSEVFNFDITKTQIKDADEKDVEATVSITENNGVMIIADEVVSVSVSEITDGKIIFAEKGIKTCQIPSSKFAKLTGPFILVITDADGNTFNKQFIFSEGTYIKKR